MVDKPSSGHSAREFTGRKMFLLTSSAFALIIVVNVIMAFKAVSTFPGLEVANSYVASQSFDAERRAQLALGWTATVAADGSGFRLVLSDDEGLAVRPARLEVTIGRATERGDDQRPELAFEGGAWLAPLTLAKGYWQVWLEAEAQDGTRFRQRLDLRVKG